MSTQQYPMYYHNPQTVADLKAWHLDDDPSSWYIVACRTILQAEAPCEEIVRKFDHFNEQFQRCESIEDLQIMVCQRVIEGKL